jgi:hypothetical protein
MWRTLAFGLALVAISAQTQAQPSAGPSNCADFRKNILDMENASVRPPGWVMFDSQLRLMYAKQCIVAPTRRAATEYWYRSDGTPLGIRADYTPPGWDQRTPYRPDGGAYIATPEIGALCAKATNPSLCALAKDVEADCLAPVDTQQRTQCEGILAGRMPDLPQPSEALPPIADLIGPARAAAPRLSDAQISADPGFQRMCAAANQNFNTCAVRRQNMTTMGTGGLGGGSSQAGAFEECQQLYGSVLNMCAATKLVAAPTKPAPTNPPPQQAKAAPPRQEAKPAGGDSRPPPGDPDAARKQQALSQMSPQCRGELNQLLQGADSGDQAKAANAYGSLRGQCDPSLRSLAGIGGLGLPERIMTSRSQRLLDRAMAGDEGAVPGRAAEAAQAGGSSFDMGQVLDFGIALLGVMNGVAGVYSPVSGGLYATRMGSIGNRPVRGTYGQGGPSGPSPGATIYGNGLREGTAR